MVEYMKAALVGVLLLLGIYSNSFSVSNEKDKKGIYYDHVTYTDNVSFHGVDGLDLDFHGNLSYLGDFFEIDFDVVNDTSVDIEIAKCQLQNNPYIEYQLTYDNGDDVQLGDVIKRGESKKLKYKVLYKNPILDQNYQFDSGFQIQYEQVL